eukprot:TRINITY_DN80483_c0_g1_i1.p1 TRINITY_DN80483_c0_g1~~TRINITY_DN80483_c0_g1_i1.p1  ORF type:complete len:241 (+),score=52.95 TRINITY_DN80483_c0_g1_i1:138-860(+)
MMAENQGSQEGEEFEVMLERSSPQEAIGMKILFPESSCLLVKSIKEAGLIPEWNTLNQAFPGVQVHVGDFVMEVNESRGDAAAMVNKLKESSLRLKVKRGLRSWVIPTAGSSESTQVGPAVTPSWSSLSCDVDVQRELSPVPLPKEPDVTYVHPVAEDTKLPDPATLSSLPVPTSSMYGTGGDSPPVAQQKRLEVVPAIIFSERPESYDQFIPIGEMDEDTKDGDWRTASWQCHTCVRCL